MVEALVIRLPNGEAITADEYRSTLNARQLELNPNPESLQELKETYKKYLRIDQADDEIIDVVLAAVCERRVEGDPAWIFIIGASGCFKTELCRAPRLIPEVYTLDSITGQTLISGKVEKNESGEYEPIAGILKHLNGKVLVIKDFTTILSMKEETRQQILGDLRAAHDGYLEKAYGTLAEPIRVKASFGLLAAVTPAIDKYVKTAVTLGERFLKIRVHGDTRLKTAKKALSNLGNEDTMRTAIQNATKNYVDKLNFTAPVTVSEHWQNKIINMALYAATTRAHVWAKFYHGEIVDLEPPEIEFPTRIAKQMLKLGKLLCYIRRKTEYTEAEHRTLTRIAKDCGLPIRQKIIDYYQTQPENHQATTQEIAQNTGTNWKTAKAQLEKMQALNIVEGEYPQTITHNNENTQYEYGPESWQITHDFQNTIHDASLYLTPPGGKDQGIFPSYPLWDSDTIEYKEPST